MKCIPLFVILFNITLGCQSQKKDRLNLEKQDIELAKAYEKFYENRADYASEKNEARDTILNRFKSGLLKTLSDEKFIGFSFDSLSKTIKEISSKDKKLRIFSWDELNGGTWHIYNSAYQYTKDGQSFSGLLSLENYTMNNPLSTDIIHLEIENIDSNSYLVKGYGTHGAGKDFYVYRLLSFQSGKLVDCSKCFNGEDRFVFVKMRGQKIKPNYNVVSREISYPEMIADIKDGEETGFEKPSGKIIKLKYKAGLFVKIDN